MLPSVLHAYFDESGTHAESPVTCVTGYLFEEDQAEHLAREWSRTLADFGLTYFHAVESANRRNEFATLSREDDLELTKRLIGIIKRRMLIGVAYSVWEDGSIEWARGDAYVLCATLVLNGVVSWANERGFKGQILYFYEDGHRYESLVRRIIEKLTNTASSSYRCLDVQFRPKKDCFPLQAADLLAYEWRHEILRTTIAPRPARPMSRALESLLEMNHYYQHLGPSALEKFVEGKLDELIEGEMKHFKKVE